ncbi:hypothetical protein AXF42_Ash013144 [Apostasia shenzhenica]|uniref:Uncharacterized protein n=1 Tax=Apostasia shenzhenica TaxID=1088818 RepID=A0A2I0BD51_9ASPA|nr:hypothetical protein AXF42_Ash013144 [Apostasia shenzhenica]
MSTGKTKKDTRLQNLNTRSDEFRPLNQGPSPRISSSSLSTSCRLSIRKMDPSSASKEESSPSRLRS